MKEQMKTSREAIDSHVCSVAQTASQIVPDHESLSIDVFENYANNFDNLYEDRLTNILKRNSCALKYFRRVQAQQRRLKCIAKLSTERTSNTHATGGKTLVLNDAFPQMKGTKPHSGDAYIEDLSPDDDSSDDEQCRMSATTKVRLHVRVPGVRHCKYALEGHKFAACKLYPPMQAFVTVGRNVRGEEQPVLRYCPYFGDDVDVQQLAEVYILNLRPNLVAERQIDLMNCKRAYIACSLAATLGPTPNTLKRIREILGPHVFKHFIDSSNARQSSSCTPKRSAPMDTGIVTMNCTSSSKNGTSSVVRWFCRDTIEKTFQDENSTDVIASSASSHMLVYESPSMAVDIPRSLLLPLTGVRFARTSTRLLNDVDHTSILSEYLKSFGQALQDKPVNFTKFMTPSEISKYDASLMAAFKSQLSRQLLQYADTVQGPFPVDDIEEQHQLYKSTQLPKALRWCDAVRSWTHPKQISAACDLLQDREHRKSENDTSETSLRGCGALCISAGWSYSNIPPESLYTKLRFSQGDINAGLPVVESTTHGANPTIGSNALSVADRVVSSFPSQLTNLTFDDLLNFDTIDHKLPHQHTNKRQRVDISQPTTPQNDYIKASEQHMPQIHTKQSTSNLPTDHLILWTSRTTALACRLHNVFRGSVCAAAQAMGIPCWELAMQYKTMEKEFHTIDYLVSWTPIHKTNSIIPLPEPSIPEKLSKTHRRGGKPNKADSEELRDVCPDTIYDVDRLLELLQKDIPAHLSPQVRRQVDSIAKHYMQNLVTEATNNKIAVKERLALIRQAKKCIARAIADLADVYRKPVFVGKHVILANEDDLILPIIKPAVYQITNPTDTMKLRARQAAVAKRHLKARTDRRVYPAEVVCHHEGPCSVENSCPCVTNNQFCSKYCSCCVDCHNKWHGCTCETKCRTKVCPCFASDKECDPDLCHLCGAHVGVDIAFGAAQLGRASRFSGHTFHDSEHKSDERVEMPRQTIKQERKRAAVSLGKHMLLGLTDWTAATNVSVKRAAVKARLQDHCANINVRTRRKVRLYVGPSNIPNAGFGLFSGEFVERGELIEEYRGEVVSQIEAERRGAIYDTLNRSYIFDLNDDVCLDATRKGNKMRFANHSKTPNCFARKVIVSGESCIGIYAARNIKAHEELFFNYNYDKGVEHAHRRRDAAKHVGWLKDARLAGKIVVSSGSNQTGDA